MVKDKLSAILALALLVVTGGVAQQYSAGNQTQPHSAVNTVKAFNKAHEVEEPDEPSPVRFEFSLNGFRYVIAKNGRMRKMLGGKSVRSFRLMMDVAEHEDHIDHLYYAEHQGDLLLVAEVSDYEIGSGFIARLDQRTLRVKWRRPITGFNVGQGLIEGDYAYLTAIGFIGKIELRRGAYAWQHKNLYQDGSFNSFELPQLAGEAVRFKEIPTGNSPAKTIAVDKRSGKILSSQ